MLKLKIIKILLSNSESVNIEIRPSSNRAHIEEISEAEARDNGEATVQVKEACVYEYKLDDGFVFNLKKGGRTMIKPSQFHPSTGVFTPGSFVGSLTLHVVKHNQDNVYGAFQIEVQSAKVDYRTDYRTMLEEIAEKCTELIMQHSMPLSQSFVPDQMLSGKTIYQRFNFIKAFVNADEFDIAIHKIIQSPVTVWEEEEAKKDISRVRRLNRKQLTQIATAAPGVNIRLSVFNKKETVDAPENRFVKYALRQFLDLCIDFRTKLKDDSAHIEEVLRLERKLQQYLNHQVFKKIGALHTVPLNSPILQRKEGYRVVLRAWIMGMLAAQITWQGGEDVYEGGKKDVATLYEYWLFFKLHDLIIKVFKLKHTKVDKLIEPTNDGLGLKLKRGLEVVVEGVSDYFTRKLHVSLSYNKTFSSKKRYPDAGSWTTSLRPDYTLSVWPFGVSKETAEKEELIVHIHFDAKYKVDHLNKPWDEDIHPDEDKKASLSGKIKNAELIKMHAYRDAIRRTAGAYVLYPGEQSTNYRGFHELLPGLGAFSVRPLKQNSGIEELEAFLQDLIGLLVNRTSQLEKMALNVFNIHKEEPSASLSVSLPEPYGANRRLLAEETAVLIGYYKGENHLEWIKAQRLYNTRIQPSTGDFYLDPSLMAAKYLLLHTRGEKESVHFFKLLPKGGRVFTKEKLIEHKYPTKPSQTHYLVFEIEESAEAEFFGKKWDVTKLVNYSKGKGYGLPFATNLAEIMRVIIAE